jgi:hypothetical protein
MLNPQDRKFMSESTRDVWRVHSETATVFTRTALSGNAIQDLMGLGRTPSYATGIIRLMPSWYTEKEIAFGGGVLTSGHIPIYTRVKINNLAMLNYNGDRYEVVAGPHVIDAAGGSAMGFRYHLNKLTTGSTL